MHYAMRVAAFSVALFAFARAKAPPPPDPQLDCDLRSLALNVSIARVGSFADVGRIYDALQLSTCGIPRPPTRSVAAAVSVSPAAVVFVSSSRGDDNADGAAPERPLATLVAAQAAARSLRRTLPASERVTVLLDGRFHLRAPLTLGDAADAHTTWRAWPGGSGAVVSGGVALRGLSWAASTRYPPPVLEAFLPAGELPPTFDGLFDGDAGTRLPLAREPNGNVETDLQPTGWALVDGNPNGSVPFPGPGAGTHFEVDAPARNSSVFPVFGRDYDPR